MHCYMFKMFAGIEGIEVYARSSNLVVWPDTGRIDLPSSL